MYRREMCLFLLSNIQQVRKVASECCQENKFKGGNEMMFSLLFGR